MVYCPWCMKKNNDNSFYCSHCGKRIDVTNEPHQLTVGVMLNGRYHVGVALRQGGFGITYVGCDTRLDKKVAIKEYFPSELVNRVTEYSRNLTIASGDRTELYNREKLRFENEAQILAKFSGEKNVVNVTDIFNENNTVYMVMEFVEGEDLDQVLAHRGKMSFRDIYLMLRPIVKTLGRIHREGLIHRDISLANIKVLPDNTPILLDFGAAREFGGDSEKSYSVILKPGYAPPEQYDSHGMQGTWSDVYAMCATIYHAITGIVPQNSLTRMSGDEVATTLRKCAAITPMEEAVLLKGLSLSVENRIKNMEELDNAVMAAIGYESTRIINEGYSQNGNKTGNTAGSPVNKKVGDTSRIPAWVANSNDKFTILLYKLRPFVYTVVAFSLVFMIFIFLYVYYEEGKTSATQSSIENVKEDNTFTRTSYGAISSTTYRNWEFNYSFTRPSDMRFYTAEDINLLKEQAASVQTVDSNALSNIDFDMVAEDESGILSIISSFFKTDLLYGVTGDESESEIIEICVNSILEQYNSMDGFSHEYKKINYRGNSIYAIKIEYIEKLSGKHAYQEIIHLINGDTINRIIITSMGEDRCDELLKCFY